ncbi:MAG: preprotein translocase subunit SecG [Candidatus Omnitrophica bacterium]|nr:preprotein translocase subunit SecG [Candidatus Omnitrophota bacterium]
MLYYLLVLFHVVVCVALIFFILIQSNKGMGLSGAFGAMGAGDSVFGSSGGMNILIKITIALCLVFTVTTMALTMIPPPTQSGGIIDQEFSNRPQSTSDFVNQTQAAGGSTPPPADAAPADEGANQASQ